MKLKRTLSLSLLIAAIMIGGAFALVKKHEEAQAQVENTINIPFTGKISNMEICCNGVKFSLTHPPLSTPQTMGATFIFPWQNMIPIPLIGWGLYSWWSLTSGETVLGSATIGGVCITIYSECESESTVQYSVNQMGTTLMSTPIAN